MSALFPHPALAPVVLVMALSLTTVPAMLALGFASMLGSALLVAAALRTPVSQPSVAAAPARG